MSSLEPSRRRDLLISDATRERLAARLREHYAAGRIEREEMERRVELAVAARTRADIEGVLAGLPRASRRERRLRRQRVLLRMHATGAAAGNGTALAVWAVLGANDPWIVLVLGPSAAALSAHWAAVRSLAQSVGRRR